MGRMDPAVLSVRCPRSAKKSLVPVWLSVSHRRNVQGATVIRDAVFHSLAIVAKKVGPRAMCARRVHCDGGSDRGAVASTNAGGLDRTCCCHCLQFAISSATQFATSNRFDQRDRRMLGICDWGLHRWKLRVVAGWFSVRKRALPLPGHQFVLQPSIASLQGWLVIEGSSGS